MKSEGRIGVNILEKRFDVEVLVVGAGPGGSMASRSLREEGREVLIVEKSPEVGRVILCAEGISRESLTKFFEPSEKWVASGLHAARLYSPNGDYMEVHRRQMGFILERKLFDRFLVMEAVGRGAELMTSTTFLEAKREDGFITSKLLKGGNIYKVRSKMIIGADGVASRVGKSLGMVQKFHERDAHYCAQYLLYHDSIREGVASFFTGSRFAPGGYGWIFPKGKGIANVGVGVIFQREMLNRFLDNLIETYLPGAKILGFIKGVVPTGGHKQPMVGDGVMLVGDAARLAEPLSGAGIASAMYSGYLAGHIAGKALKNGDTSTAILSEYEKEYWKGTRREYEFSYLVRNTFMRFTDEDLNLILEELNPIFHGKSLEDISPFYIARKALISRRVWNLLVKAGKGAIGQYLREFVHRG